eukprot:TRINITY_DN14614_c0_g1_i1.p1 TRINITY_DN14614_c0_g1~~TRINITY_DN14614_c0_g1_i1.p1  ORF type:complete len:100 (-),score=23.94 TRINITY_DN14614_c0_g1_i1:56-355(-)
MEKKNEINTETTLFSSKKKKVQKLKPTPDEIQERRSRREEKRGQQLVEDNNEKSHSTHPFGSLRWNMVSPNPNTPISSEENDIVIRVMTFNILAPCDLS